MVSTNIKGMDLSDEELKHLMVEVCDMAMGMLSGGAVPSAPIHEDILLTLMFELLPYDNSRYKPTALPTSSWARQVP